MDEYLSTYAFESKRPWLSPWRSAMRKEMTLYFHSDQKLCRSLEMIADEKKQPVPAAIAAIVEEYVRSHDESAKHTEKRRFGRKFVLLPAMLTAPGSPSTESSGGLILDLSLGGLCVSLGDGIGPCDAMTEEDARFTATFTVPDVGKAVTMLCEKRWSMTAGGSTHVGATFVDGAFLQYQILQEFLMQ